MPHLGKLPIHNTIAIQVACHGVGMPYLATARTGSPAPPPTSHRSLGLAVFPGHAPARPSHAALQLQPPYCAPHCIAVCYSLSCKIQLQPWLHVALYLCMLYVWGVVKVIIMLRLH